MAPIHSGTFTILIAPSQPCHRLGTNITPTTAKHGGDASDYKRPTTDRTRSLVRPAKRLAGGLVMAVAV